MKTTQIKIGDGLYNSVKLTAVEQDKLLSSCAKSLMGAVVTSENKTVSLSKQGLMILLVTMPQDQKTELSNALLANTKKAGNESALTAYDFDDVMRYNELLVKLIEFNFASFFTYWVNVLKEQKETKAQNQ